MDLRPSTASPTFASARGLPVLFRLLVVVAALAPTLHAGDIQGQATPGEALPVTDVTLDNGLRLLVLSREGSPTVSLVVQYRVGSAHEARGATGTAHLLEHLLFKGTTSIGTRDAAGEAVLLDRIDRVHDSLSAALGQGPADASRVRTLRDELRALEDTARTWVVPNEFSRILSDHGARNLNATTTHEATTYYVELPANRVELWFALEADRLTHPVFREFFAERDVVLEERLLRVENDPAGKLREELLGRAFVRHPYGSPVVGREADLRTLDRETVAGYFERYYGPNNAVVAIVGAVEPDRVVDLARRYLGPIDRRLDVPAVQPVEPPQESERRATVSYDAEPRLAIGWKIPPAGHPDAPALTMLTSLLAGGRTARLHRRLVIEERSATTVLASAGPGQRDTRILEISVVPRGPHSTTDVEAAIYEEVDRLRSQAPAPDEISRVRTQVVADHVRRLRSNLGLAFQLAESAALFGDWRATFRRAALVQRVEPADVQRVVRRYLTPERRTVVTLVPADSRRPGR